MEELRNEWSDIMAAAGVTVTKMHIASESARYLDITEVNTQDTWQVMITISILISIMLIARIREEMSLMSFEDGVRKGLERAGGVISSAEIILL